MPWLATPLLNMDPSCAYNAVAVWPFFAVAVNNLHALAQGIHVFPVLTTDTVICWSLGRNKL